MDSYRDVIYSMSSKLTRDECQDIAILYNLHQRYHEERPFKVLIQLEKEQIISETCPGDLVAVLKKINRVDLANEAKKLSATLKKNNKKKPPAPLISKSALDSANIEFAFARKQVDQLATTLSKLQRNQLATLSKLQTSSEYEYDQEISDAIDNLKLINKHLTKAEKHCGLTSTKTFIDSFPDDNSSSSSSGHSSISSNISQEELLYEPMDYVRPQIETGHIDSKSNMERKVRPPLPAPKPTKKATNSNSAPLPKKVVLLRQSTECGTTALTPQMGRPLIPLPGLTGRHHSVITSSSQETEGHDDNYDDITGGSGSTGDSGRGTGSDYGFSDVRPFLRQSIIPRTKTNMYPVVPPKPTRYMSLTTRNISEDEYTRTYRE